MGSLGTVTKLLTIGSKDLDKTSIEKVYKLIIANGHIQKKVPEHMLNQICRK